ncbi:hypothetical protein PCC7418_0199 [Halothece sp. PCC 7418]|uniref:hypothetical protein n=1 Tax=Halothece sp. (strain PCC 7418) TaxID=65093 RepID=UPI0002A075FC|nr:hypothetical protein [Halothece sp. PCC 7418]AFZ42437.1 hypothetical protein PCC7418_0199 [Halothece sp. PCC 7418]
MKQINLAPTFLLGAGLLATLGAVNPAQAITYTTTVTPDSPISNLNEFQDPVDVPNNDTLNGDGTIEQIIVEFSTNVTSGQITEADLTNLTFSLVDTDGGSGTIFTDNAISGGVVQPLETLTGDTVSRVVDFEFDIDNNLIGGFDNDVNVDQSSPSINGISYNIFAAESGGEITAIALDEYLNGSSSGGGFDPVDASTSEVETTAVPWQTDVLPGFVAIGLLFFWRERRKQRQLT